MKITEVKIDKLFSTSSYLNDRVGVVVAVGDKGDPMQALIEANKLAIEFNKREYPELYLFNDKPMTADEVDTVIKMNNCDSVVKLSRFKNNLTPVTKKYYKDKETELKGQPVYEKVDMP